MAQVFKLIKSTEFELDGKKHKTHVVAYKGRALNANELAFAESPEYKFKIDANAKTLTIEGGDISVVQAPYLDAITGETRVGLKIMPKFDLAIDSF